MQIIEHSVVGTRSAVLRLRRPGAELQFVVFPMIHVASPQFYAEVTERLRRCDLLVVEGVSGRSARLSALTLTYRVVPANRRSGLVVDNIPYGRLGVPVINPDVSGAEVDAGLRAMSWRARLAVWALMPLVSVGSFLFGRRYLLGPDVEVDDLPGARQQAIDDHELSQELDGVLLGPRDERLLDALVAIDRERSAERIDVAVVYGAGHTTAIVHGLFKRLGYRPRSSEWLTVLAPELPPPDRLVPAQRAPEPTGVPAATARVARARELAGADPDGYEPELAAALDELAQRLDERGRYEEALRAADEAVDVCDALEERRPGSYRAELGIATGNFASQLVRLGRYADALAVNRQAVAILRDAGWIDAVARAERLGHALTNLAVGLHRAGLDGEAQRAAEEAVELYRSAGEPAAGRLTAEQGRAQSVLASLRPATST